MKNHTTATVIAHSTSRDIEIISFELEYPRMVHAEAKTHRVLSLDDAQCEIHFKESQSFMDDKMLSRNSSSSRAIPVSKQLDMVSTNPAWPVFWGKNKPGMQADEELTSTVLDKAKEIWQRLCNQAVEGSKELNELGLHKQLANRPTEPWVTMKVIVTATEWDNFFELRRHKDAQPEIRELANKMYEALQNSTPMALKPGEWHLPYITLVQEGGKYNYYDNNRNKLSLEEAKIVSASCCAQVSYRNLDDTLEKAKKIYKLLIESEPRHASPVEHQATPMTGLNEKGVTHMTRDDQLWSGNFRGWIQLRQLIDS
jgi:thymidylate synthase ThyX